MITNYGDIPLNNWASLVLLIIFICSLAAYKLKGIKWAGNFQSLTLTFSVSIFVNIINPNGDIFYKYMQGFYAGFGIMAIGLLFASGRILLLNTLFILLSSLHVYFSSIKYYPENQNLFSSAIIYYIIILIGSFIIYYFDVKFAEEAIHMAREDARIKELQNQELISREEEIRAANEELRATTDALSQMNEELIYANKKAEESSRLKSVFLTNISHEIRTPMNGIVGFARMLDDRDLPDHTKSYYIDIVIKSSEQLLKIIDDTLEISKLVSKKQTIDYGEVNIGEIIDRLLKMFTKQAGIKGIELFSENKLNKWDSYCVTDEERLFRILYNLVDNSVKFTHSGFIKIAVELKNDYYEFLVQDTGIGFDQHNSFNIFDSFVQADEKIAVDYGGLGVGLAIVKESVELLDGELFHNSEINKGTSFYFRIPYKPSSKQVISPSDIITKSIVPEVKGDHKVLIAEDEEYNFLFFNEIIKKMNMGIHLFRAKNGKEALEMVRAIPELDLVLMDIKMPVMNGIEATREIKNIYPDLPVIAQSAYTSEIEKKMAHDAGCNGFISKPINVEEFRQILVQYLAEKGEEQVF
ncbi:MAG: ATP-binding protein [Bacteroidales bacterium]